MSDLARVVTIRDLVKIGRGIERKTLRSMDDAEISAQAHFLLGARHFLEQMIEQADGPHEEAVFDAYIALLRDGLSRKGSSRNGTVPRTPKTLRSGGSKTMEAAGHRRSRRKNGR